MDGMDSYPIRVLFIRDSQDSFSPSIRYILLSCPKHRSLVAYVTVFMRQSTKV